VAFLRRAGLRCSGALDLAPRDVDFEAGTLRVREGKGRKADMERPLSRDPVLVLSRNRWLGKRAELGVGRNASAFCLSR
jgi:integrase